MVLMMHQLWNKQMLDSPWVKQGPKLPLLLQTLFLMMITSPQQLLHSSSEEMFMTASGNSFNFSYLSMLLPCSLSSLVQSFWKTLHWMPFKCSGSIWSWIHLVLWRLLPKNQLMILFWDNLIKKIMLSSLLLCGEMFSVMLFTNAPYFYS